MMFITILKTALVICLSSGVAASPAVHRRDAKTPMQVRLAYAGQTGMMVSWNTFSKLSNPTVRYGLSPNALSKTASSNVSVTYQSSTTFNNHVQLTSLKPDTVYYYQPSYGKALYNFTTSRLTTDHTPFTAALVVDMGTMGELGLSHHVGNGAANPLKKGELNTIKSLAMHKSEFDFLWHPGDIAYADYWLKEEIQGYLPNTTIQNGYKVYESILNKYYDEMERITAFKPYMVGPGNHEANCDNGGTTNPNTGESYTYRICVPGQTNFTGYINHFRMPSEQSGGTGNFWYSFDHGMAHFVQLDTETDLGHNLVGPDEIGGPEGEHSGPFNATMNAQVDWLAADLAAVDRTKTPWIIVAGHHPWYVSIANSSSDICTNCKDAFEPLLIRYHVDLVLSGHVHFYERNAPIANYAIDPRGLNNPSAPWYITNGAAGHYDGLDTIQYPIQNYSRFAQDQAYGWSKLIFHNCSHLTHEFVASGNGSVLDSATLFKDRKC